MVELSTRAVDMPEVVGCRNKWTRKQCSLASSAGCCKGCQISEQGCGMLVWLSKREGVAHGEGNIIEEGRRTEYNKTREYNS